VRPLAGGITPWPRPLRWPMALCLATLPARCAFCYVGLAFYGVASVPNSRRIHQILSNPDCPVCVGRRCAVIQDFGPSAHLRERVVSLVLRMICGCSRRCARRFCAPSRLVVNFSKETICGDAPKMRRLLRAFICAPSRYSPDFKESAGACYCSSQLCRLMRSSADLSSRFPLGCRTPEAVHFGKEPTD
jgi:hypothetical protein